MSKPALGRGLGALLGGAATASPPIASEAAVATSPGASAAADAGERVQRVAVNRLRPSPFQPRQEFTNTALRELADSIREQGVVQPLIVRARGEQFELIAGERRWRAAQLAGLTEVPVIVREAGDTEALELALIENLQRENLNPIEEALGYRQLIEQFHLRQEDAAQKVGRSRVVVANALRLLKLADELQAHVRSGRLSVGHAKVILGLADPAEQKLAAERVLADGLNVRQTEELVTRMQAGPTLTSARNGRQRVAGSRDVHVAALETRIQERLGTRVHLRYREGRGALEIRFFNEAELERILGVLGVSAD
ncbi:MAG: ParB/RepB/Spo0J family partition protein [Verrucomicrobiales bacterium]|nr:ParB/RepB/Spo0J family partition protein [Verrucomicrobiales bacterium]